MKMSRWLLTCAIALGLCGLGVSTASAQKPEGTPANNAAKADKKGPAGKKNAKKKAESDEEDKSRGKKQAKKGEDSAKGQAGDKARGKARGEKPADKPGERADRGEDEGEARASDKGGKMAKKAKKAKPHPDQAIEKELQKHAKRIATIERLSELAEGNDNSELDEKAAMLLEKEQKRHEQKLARLKAERGPDAKPEAAENGKPDTQKAAEGKVEKAKKAANQKKGSE